MSKEAHDAAVLDFENRDEPMTHVRTRQGVCQEFVPDKGEVCGAPVVGMERWRGTSVIVSGACAVGHEFSRAGYAAVDLYEELGTKAGPADELTLQRAGWTAVPA